MQMCVLRYERKHQYFKRLAHILCNFRNLPYTFAKRHQAQQYVNWKDGMPTKSSQEFSSGKLIPREHTEIGHITDGTAMWIAATDGSVFKAESVMVMGTRYRSGDCVMHSYADSNPVFIKIVEIFKGADGNVVFLGNELCLERFDEHSQSYLVRKASLARSNWKVCRHSDLFDYHPMFFITLHDCFDRFCGYYHICLRHRILYNNFASQ